LGKGGYLGHDTPQHLEYEVPREPAALWQWGLATMGIPKKHVTVALWQFCENVCYVRSSWLAAFDLGCCEVAVMLCFYVRHSLEMHWHTQNGSYAGGVLALLRIGDDRDPMTGSDTITSGPSVDWLECLLTVC
jgi:hypothetical protein